MNVYLVSIKVKNSNNDDGNLSDVYDTYDDVHMWI